MLDYEKNFSQYKLICGIDEAGRGPLAGPVCCACVIMPMEEKLIIDGINDSKKLSAKKRELLFKEIKEKAIDYKICFIDKKTIDKINILEATKQGMEMCVLGLKTEPDIVLVDAVKGLNLKTKTVPIIHGDALSYNIACASILAKVTRDEYMKEMDKKYPQYNFAKHKGYGTKEHIENLKKFGKCEIHRESFIKHFV